MCGGVVVTDIVTETVLDLTDPSLTSSSVLAAVEGVSADRLASVLQIPYYKRKELREQFPDDEDYKKKVVNFYRNLSPTSSWGHLAGRLLLRGEDAASQRARSLYKPHPGKSRLEGLIIMYSRML